MTLPRRPRPSARPLPDSGDRLRRGLESQTVARPARPLAPTPYRGFVCNRLNFPPQEFPGHVAPHYTVIAHVGPPLPLEYRDGGDWRATTVTEQVAQVYDRGPLGAIRWQAEAVGCCLLLDPEFVASANDEPWDRAPELAGHARAADPQLVFPVLALAAEVEQGCPNGRLYGESLALAVAVRLLRGYAAGKPAGAAPAGGLSAAALRRVVELITDRLAENLSLADLADEAGLSPYHFARLFRQSTGEPPHRFQLRRRVEEAARLLGTGLHTPAEVASRLGFADQSHLSRHFKNFTGLTPGKAFQAARTSRLDRKPVQD